MNLFSPLLRAALATVGILVAIGGLSPASAQPGGEPREPWMNTDLSPDERAALVLKEMTLDEKISLLHGTGMRGLGPMSPLAVKSNGGAGWASPRSRCPTRHTV
jgi:beta-glucosidase